MSRTRKLDPIEIRVLGALMEKELTTPDQYPLTINGVIAACNQKSNRDPVMSLSETDVVEALDRLREDVLTWRTMGARTERWQHSLDRRWDLDPKSKAIMCLLLLRGPQTVGELRTRSERMYAFASLTEVEETLQRLAEGFDALVRQLPRRPGQREIRWIHLEGREDPREAAEEAPPSPAATSPAAVPAAPVRPLETAARHQDDDRLERLERAVDELRTEVRSLREKLDHLRTELGVED